MEEQKCSNCGCYTLDMLQCQTWKNPITPNFKIKVDPECPACSNYVTRK